MATLPSTAQLYAKIQRELQGYGNAEQQRLRQSYQAAMGTAMQSLASSGLAGTTIAPSMRLGYMRQYQQSLNELGQQLQKSRLGAEATFGLGGIQLEQSQEQLRNQFTLGLGNLGVSRQYADIARSQLELQRQQTKNQYRLASSSYATPSRGSVSYPGGFTTSSFSGYR